MAEIERDVFVIGYGRFNPPTKGHEKAVFDKVINDVKKLSKQGEVYGLFITTRSTDNKKNPLSINSKMMFLEAILGNKLSSKLKMYNPKIESGAKVDVEKSIEMFAHNKDKHQFGLCHAQDIFKALATLSQNTEQPADIVLWLGKDELPMGSRVMMYNGKLYNFNSIKIENAGERGGDSGLSGISATKMRNAALADDFETFDSMCADGLDQSQRKLLFTAVKNGLNR